MDNRASDGEDIYDLVWSPDDCFLLIGLTDNTAQIWDLNLSREDSCAFQIIQSFLS